LWEVNLSQPFTLLFGINIFFNIVVLFFDGSTANLFGCFLGLSLCCFDFGELGLPDGDLLKGVGPPLLLVVKVLVLDHYLLELNFLEGGVVARGQKRNSDEETNAGGHLEFVINPCALGGGLFVSGGLRVNSLHAVTPGILGGEVVIDTIVGGVVIIDCDSKGPDNDQEGSTEKVEGSHEVSSNVEEPDLGNPVLRN